MPDSVSPPVDLDLRLVWCFTVVAEHGHFGRAAEVLHTTQPSLSRQIRRLENQLGARLIDRGPQGSKLTEAGEVFLPLARKLLRTANQAKARTQAAARPSRLTIGYIAGVIVTPVVRELRNRHPDAEVNATHLRWEEPRTALLEHRVDAAVTRLPFPTSGLDVTVLYDEPRALMVPREHRFAGKESVTLADIADEPMLRLRNASQEWQAFWRAEPRPDGRPVPDGPSIDAIEDKFEHIAAGEAVAIVPADLGFAGLRPDVTAVLIEDIEPSHVVLATRSGDGNRLLPALEKCVRAHLTGPVHAAR
ncbi:LysR family transcriptional regulator [Sciscionella sediminilitoris]|uniref:LysR family transcriptional regulator n=1 Tax=Sciscionella sediminilitoris TaxID=1445613 RepID=UPI0004DF58AA|nr:LysR family transcriptional regulator [Sciscionella sp. SE31]